MIWEAKMDNKEIYEENIKEYFRQIKNVKEQWNQTKETAIFFSNENLVCNIDSEDMPAYTFAMEQCHDIINQLIISIIEELLSKNKPEIIILYYLSNGELIKKSEYKRKHSEQKIKKLAFLACEDEKKFIYFVKEFGINNRCFSLKVNYPVKYISLVYENAYHEIINHNNNKNDPSRGTDTYSIKWFFEHFFTIDEFLMFRSYVEDFAQKVKKYLGINIVRLLVPNSIFPFKEIVLNELLSFNINQDSTLNSKQIEILKKHFNDESNYLSMIGSCNFAQSFQTAEWMYRSLRGSDNIDLTSISMGYFKAVEQLLFAFISAHTFEKDKKKRKISIFGHLNDLTDSVIDQQGDEICLKSLTRFLGEINDYSFRPRNRDLLYSDIDSDTYEYIIKSLNPIVEIRNKYFHKENITDWTKIERDRKTVYKFLCLFFSAYKISDKSMFGFSTVEQDDYYKLCEYIHNKSFYENNPLDIPVYTVNDNTILLDCLPDESVKFDDLGNRVYSGVYFRSNKASVKKISVEFHRNSLPKIIREGCLHIGRKNNKISCSLSWPEKVIFEDGKFFEK